MPLPTDRQAEIIKIVESTVDEEPDSSAEWIGLQGLDRVFLHPANLAAVDDGNAPPQYTSRLNFLHTKIVNSQTNL